VFQRLYINLDKENPDLNLEQTHVGAALDKGFPWP
jgi:hypothetical protein